MNALPKIQRGYPPDIKEIRWMAMIFTKLVIFTELRQVGLKLEATTFLVSHALK
ncbi:hypothetical protein KIN20_020015 [Parelaphostrongylus tenuis]|uniref:Uncharacterized protein n=1 Tax=Parelaphostrongylus tenuis TaxID=148309 RepID=A0AAD5N2U2_PARTN|nr:hypothetical protein KIN20_020015 [Parelaphostrongylus tenuis]